MANDLFSQLNLLAEEKLADVSLTAGKYFNYYKVVQHALSYSGQLAPGKILKNRIDQPVFIQALYYRIKSLVRPSVNVPVLHSILLFEGGRYTTTPDGKIISVYFHRVQELFDRSTLSIVQGRKDSALKDFDLSIDQFSSLSNRPLKREEHKVFNDVRDVYKNLNSSGIFTPLELQYISSAFHLFLEDFHRAYQLLSDSNVKVLLSETHYHKEGIIAAAKLLGVKFIEFQHGLISRKDLYYVYRKDIATVAGDALFPDKLLVFGPYWKSLLLEGGEHTESTIACVGDYSYVAPAPQGVKKREVLFIGAQKNMGDVYIPYIEQICSQILPNHAGWELWVKLHPFEKQPERYHALKHLHGLKLFGNESNLHELLASSKIQVSVYSTTFYDALGLDVLNLSIQNYSDQSDYAREMVSELVAFPVEFTDDPIAVYKAGLGGDLLTRDEVYAPFNEKLFESVIRNCF